MNTEKLMRLAERVLKRNKAYRDKQDMGVPAEENFQIDYLLFKGNTAAPEDLIIYASHEDELLRLRPLDENLKHMTGYELLFNFDSDLFEYLEKGYLLTGMSLGCHFCVWSEIGEYHNYFESQDGMQKYLSYCKRSGVTKELLTDETGYDGMDVMTLYDKEAANKSKKEKTSQENER